MDAAIGVDFTYDDWGRTITREVNQGETTLYTTTYGYFMGDKLKHVVSDFPLDAAGEVQTNLGRKIGDSPVSLEDSLAWDSPPFSGKRRNKLVDDTETTWWRWDAGWNMISEHEGDGSWTVGDRLRTFIPGLAEVPGTDPDSGSYWYYAQDHLGSLRALYDGNKALIGKVEYEPYGMIRTGAGPATIPGHTYTGHMLDIETTMYFAPYRNYSPMTARWMTRDPLGFVDGTNRWLYVQGRPTVASDPFGLETKAECIQKAEDALTKRQKKCNKKHPYPSTPPPKTCDPEDTKKRLENYECHFKAFWQWGVDIAACNSKFCDKSPCQDTYFPDPEPPTVADPPTGWWPGWPSYPPIPIVFGPVLDYMLPQKPCYPDHMVY